MQVFKLLWIGKNQNLDPIILISHLDVVPAEGKWTYPPFSGEIVDGKLFGRGTLDTKGGLYCMLEAAEELIKDNFVPNQDIYFESACTEEVDGGGPGGGDPVGCPGHCGQKTGPVGKGCAAHSQPDAEG